MRSSVSQLSIHKLEVFLKVAELKSVSNAAEHLHIAQPVVSAHIKSLSEKLGVKLIERDGRRIVLTDDGQQVFQWAQDIIIRTQELERVLADTHQGLAGKAIVGASMTLGSYVLPGILSSIQPSYPHGDISVDVMAPSLVTEAVRQGECDFAFSMLGPQHEIFGLEVERVRDEHLVLVASDISNVHDGEVSLEEISSLPFIAPPQGTPRREIEEHLLIQYGVIRKRIVMEFGSAEAIKHAVRAGTSVAFLFESAIADELASGVLQQIRTPGMELHIPMYLIRRKNKKLTKFQNNILDEITRLIRN